MPFLNIAFPSFLHPDLKIFVKVSLTSFAKLKFCGLDSPYDELKDHEVSGNAGMHTNNIRAGGTLL